VNVFGFGIAHAQNSAYDRGSAIMIGSFACPSAGGKLFVGNRMKMEE